MVKEKKKVTKEKKIETSKVNEKELFDEKNIPKSKTYFSYSTRLFVYFTLFIIFFTIGDIYLIKSFTIANEKTAECKESSNIDYKVYLKENNFYEKDYLEKDMVYVANLIDKIKINFDYDFDVNNPINLDFTYSVIGKLVITNNNEKTEVNPKNSNKFLEKEYKLLNEKTVNLKNKKHLDINEPITINYDKYNKIANSFKSTYGVETKSNLIVYMVIHEKNNPNEKEYTIDKNNEMNITIPLSDESIDINMDYKEINSTNNIESNNNSFISNLVYILVGIVLVTISIINIVKAVKLIDHTRAKKSIYDKYINKLLKEYDKSIVETSSIPNFYDKEILKIEKFTELLDVRDNLKLPIMYYIVTKHQKCYFYISNNGIMYLHTVKAVDLESKNEK